jgi:hypothetical protein
LIAVPPNENQELDTDTISQIVMETRELARARMVTPQDLGDLAGFLPLAMVPTRTPTEVHFDWVRE